MGKIPGSLGRQHDVVEWIPVDIAAEAVVDLTLSRLDAESQVAGDALACFNIVNPQVASWSVVADAVRAFYADRYQADIREVNFDEWLGDLMAVNQSGEGTGAERYPALKLLDFFQGMGGESIVHGRYGFATERAVANSTSMSEVARIDDQLMKKWLEGWGF